MLIVAHAFLARCFITAFEKAVVPVGVDGCVRCCLLIAFVVVLVTVDVVLLFLLMMLVWLVFFLS